MSSRIGENEINNIVRRVANVPRNLLGGFSRAVNQGMDLIGGRRNYHHHYQNFHSQPPSNVHMQHHPMVQEEWAFLANFEQQYGAMHPFFYACRFTDALKIAQNEHKLMFMYIHSPEHPFTPSFCRETLCVELIVQFLDANFVCWAGLSGRGEGLEMGTSLRVSGFPFCAIVAPAAGDSLAVLQQLEGPVSPSDLVEILQRTMEEQEVALGGARSKQEEKARADQRLREEQDVAYVAALQIDQEKERLQNTSSSEDRVPKTVTFKENSASKQSSNKVEPALVSAQNSLKADTSEAKKAEVTQILIRFPNGERRERSFSSTDKIQEIYGYINSLGLPGVENYRLISNFPRKVYGADQMRVTLKEADLHPKASLFLELLWH